MKWPPQKATPGGNRANATDGKADDGIVTQRQAERKAAATAIARAAMAGLAVYELKDGRFLAAWGVTRLMPDLAAVEAFLQRVEVAK